MTTRYDIRHYIRDRADYVRDIADTIEHRIKYGDPILFRASYVIGIEDDLAKNGRKKLIQTRRKLLGLEYREYRR